MVYYKPCDLHDSGWGVGFSKWCAHCLEVNNLRDPFEVKGEIIMAKFVARIATQDSGVTVTLEEGYSSPSYPPFQQPASPPTPPAPPKAPTNHAFTTLAEALKFVESKLGTE